MASATQPDLTEPQKSELRAAIRIATGKREKEKEAAYMSGGPTAKCRHELRDVYEHLLIAVQVEFLTGDSGFLADASDTHADPDRITLAIRKDDAPKAEWLGRFTFYRAEDNRIEREEEVRGVVGRAQKAVRVTPESAGGVLVAFAKEIMERYNG